jgi:hypothetical protein
MNNGRGNKKSHKAEGRTLEQHKQGELILRRRDRLQELHLQFSSNCLLYQVFCGVQWLACEGRFKSLMRMNTANGLSNHSSSSTLDEDGV